MTSHTSYTHFIHEMTLLSMSLLFQFHFSCMVICNRADVGAKPEWFVKQPDDMQYKHAHVHPHRNVNSVEKMVF